MRIVIKIGTSTLAYSTGHLNIRHIENLCKVVSDIKNAGYEVIVVSSGAVEAECDTGSLKLTDVRGGSITAEQRTGGGSIFTVRLPRCLEGGELR